MAIKKKNNHLLIIIILVLFFIIALANLLTNFVSRKYEITSGANFSTSDELNGEAIGHVKDVELSYVIKLNDGNYVKAYSDVKNIECLEGRAPDKPNEVIVGKAYAHDHNIGLGSSYSIESQIYKVVGFFDDEDKYIVRLLPDNFVMYDYNLMTVKTNTIFNPHKTLNKLKLSLIENRMKVIEYKKQNDINALQDKYDLIENETETIINDVSEQLDDAQSQIDDGYAKARQYKAELDEANEALNKAKNALDEAKGQLDKSEKEKDDARSRLDAKTTELQDELAPYGLAIDEFRDFVNSFKKIDGKYGSIMDFIKSNRRIVNKLNEYCDELDSLINETIDLLDEIESDEKPSIKKMIKLETNYQRIVYLYGLISKFIPGVELDKSISSLSNLKNRLVDFKADLGEIREVADIDISLSAIYRLIGILADLTRLESEYEQHNISYLTLKQAYDDGNEEYKQYKDEYDEVYEEYQEALNILNEANDKVKEKQSQIGKKKQDVEVELDLISKDIDTLQEQIDTLQVNWKVSEEYDKHYNILGSMISTLLLVNIASLIRDKVKNRYE